MFRPAHPISRNLDLSERARINHIPQPRRFSLLPDPDPAWQSPKGTEWEWVQNAVGRSQPSCTDSSVCSRSLYSSQMSEYTVRMVYESIHGEPLTPLGRPSSLHHQVPDKDEVETFPKFEADLENDLFADNDSEETKMRKQEHEELKEHCILHCYHLICRKTKTIDKRKGIQRLCTQNCTAPPRSEHDASSFSDLTSTTAKAAYERRDEDMLINIGLSTALPLVSHMRNNKSLDMQHFLLASPHYTPSTLLEARFYKRAAATADDMILGGIEDTLETMLKYRPNQSCLLPVGVLEDLLITLVRWDCAEWMKRWVWGGREKRGSVGIWRVEREMERSEGARALVERAEECVRDVVGGLVWWDGKRRGEGKGMDEEDGIFVNEA